MDIEFEDDWNPDENNNKDSILNKVIVNFTSIIIIKKNQ